MAETQFSIPISPPFSLPPITPPPPPSSLPPITSPLPLNSSYSHPPLPPQVAAEGVPQLLRCIVVVCGVTMATEWGLLVFCAGQVGATQSPPPPLPFPCSLFTLLPFFSLPPSRNSLPLPPAFSSSAFLLCHQLVYSCCYLLIYYGYFTLHTSHPHTLPIRTISHILPSPGRDKVWCTVQTSVHSISPCPPSLFPPSFPLPPSLPPVLVCPPGSGIVVEFLQAVISEAAAD